MDIEIHSVARGNNCGRKPGQGDVAGRRGYAELVVGFHLPRTLVVEWGGRGQPASQARRLVTVGDDAPAHPEAFP